MRKASKRQSTTNTSTTESKSKYFKPTKTQKGKPKSEPPTSAGKAKRQAKPKKKPEKKPEPTALNDTVATSGVKERLGSSFYSKPCEDLAKELLGTLLVRKLPSGEILKGMIVETEAYLGGDDKAAHSFQGKRTERIEAMYMAPGTAYVYNIYGVYSCMNVSSNGDGAAVLIRALDPVCGLDTMKKLRAGKTPEKAAKMKDKDIGSGPSKLTQALSITKDTVNKQDLLTCEHVWLEEGEAVGGDQLVVSSRVGVDYAGEWAKKPLRFYVLGSKSISVRDKAAEAKVEGAK